MLNQRKLRLLDLLAFRGELTEETKLKVLTTNEVSSLEEIYNSYSSQGDTKASVAIKKGLGPLASILWRQEKNVVPLNDALAFIDPALQINTREEALSSARDIMAERIRDNKEAKKELKNLLKSEGIIDWKPLKEDFYVQTPPKRTFEILEAESEGRLSIFVTIPEEKARLILEKLFIKKESAAGLEVRMALEDSYQKFLLPYLEVETRMRLIEDVLKEEFFSKNKSKYLLFVFPLLLLILLVFHCTHSVADGIYKKYYPNGQMMSIESYVNGKRDGGFRKFLPNGQIIEYVTYKNGILDGESREYYDNGEWKIIKNYQDGLLEGFVKEYNRQGHLVHQTYYHKNIPVQRTIIE